MRHLLYVLLFRLLQRVGTVTCKKSTATRFKIQNLGKLPAATKLTHYTKLTLHMCTYIWIFSDKGVMRGLTLYKIKLLAGQK